MEAEAEPYPIETEMDNVKLENYAKEVPGGAFPSYISLDETAAAELRAAICMKLGLPGGIDGLSLVNQIDARSVACDGVDADAPDFSVSRTLKSANVGPQQYVYLNWNRYDHVDRLRLIDLDASFRFIWYPSSDDVDVFDDSLEWVLSIHHHGAVGLAVLAQT